MDFDVDSFEVLDIIHVVLLQDLDLDGFVLELLLFVLEGLFLDQLSSLD